MYSDAWQQGCAQKETYSRTGRSGLDFAWPLLSLATHSRRHPWGACQKWRPSDHPDPLHQKLTFIKSPEHAKHMGVCEVLFQTLVWIEETTSSTGVSLPSVEAWGGDEQGGGSSENEEGHGHHEPLLRRTIVSALSHALQTSLKHTQPSAALSCNRFN